VVTMDGSHGEGGGQVLRTTLALAVLTGQAVCIENIRAGRKKPGLQAQHLTGVLAAARLCDAAVEGARLGSQTLTFAPGRPPQAGEYRFDVAEQRQGGSAGAATLVLHTVLLPLAWADGPSRVTVRGGTHVAWSPPYQYLERIYLPMLERMGITAHARMARWGWYPQGGGEVTVEVEGVPGRQLQPLQLLERGALGRLRGLSAYANLPDHVGERQARQAEKVLGAAGLELAVQVTDATPRSGRGCIGSALMLFADGAPSASAGQAKSGASWEGPGPGRSDGADGAPLALAESTGLEAAPGARFAGDIQRANGAGWAAGFSALGERGKPAERVADDACADFLRWWHSGAAVELHLADQLVLPLALASGPSAFTTCRVTQHLLTNAWVVEQLVPARVTVEGKENEAGRVTLVPMPSAASPAGPQP
jgi:RNA 3'-phosphate cyclase